MIRACLIGSTNHFNDMSHQAKPINVLIIGNHDLLHESLSNLMSMQRDITLTGTVVSNRETIEQVAYLQPDVILIDLSIAEVESLRPIQQIHQAYPHIHIIAMSGFPRRELIDRMMQAGVKRYIKRGDSALSIVKAIRDVCQKED